MVSSWTISGEKTASAPIAIVKTNIEKHKSIKNQQNEKKSFLFVLIIISGFLSNCSSGNADKAADSTANDVVRQLTE